MRKQEFNSKHLPSPARRGSCSRTASPPAPLAIGKAPSASVESIEPRPPRLCEVGRPKGRRRKNRRQSHRFFLAPAAPRRPPPRGGHPASPLPPPIGAIFKACFLEATGYWRQRVEKPRQPCGSG